MLTDTTRSPYAVVSPLPWDAVDFTDGFWADALTSCRNNTVPHLQSMFEASDISHVVENFRICAGKSEGDFDGTNFGDGDFYKWMEAALYSAAKTNNTALLSEIDSYIDLIGLAQQEDGYLSTKQILGERNHSGVTRLGDINDFEVYNFGHLFTAACLHNRVTGKTNFLEIAQKAAAYLEEMYHQNARTGEVQTAVCPSHYMGLIELYRTTKDTKYLDLAKLAIELRDSVTDGTDDNQDRLPLKQHNKIVGHAVRSNYLYAGVADLYAETGDATYKAVLDTVWRNLVDQKLYITGGCGALYNGTSPYGNFFIDQRVHQAYGYEYQLPNITAYNETCASVGSVLWAYRMFQIDPQAEYFDIIERTMLNVNLAAVSLDGHKYFYENMLRRAKKLDYELIWPLERSEYILSYCCPPNLARTITQASEYAYAVSEDTLWIGMYGASTAQITLPSKKGATPVTVTLIQTTDYPYDGSIRLSLKDITATHKITLNIRIPGWVESGSISYDGSVISLTEKDAQTYFSLEIQPSLNTLSSDHTLDVFIKFDMPVRYTVAHPLVEENTNQAAIERGPLVYCMESPDVNVTTLDDIYLDLDTTFSPEKIEIQERSMTALAGTGYCMKHEKDRLPTLYRTLRYEGLTPIPIHLIPYFAWDNRGFGEMKIWLPIAYVSKGENK
ncbi:MAG: glycoside hydrolase family 127 protein [Lachnospiraceae bacterium]